MFLRLTCVLALVCVCVSGAEARPLQSPIVIDNDIRVFTMVAALNVAGFDVELSPQYHPVRAEIRSRGRPRPRPGPADEGNPPSSHRPSGIDEDQLAKYISLAVTLTDPPTFKINTREEALPDDARRPGFCSVTSGILPKGRSFQTVGGVWSFYEGEMDRLGPSIRDVIARTGLLFPPARVSRSHQPIDEDRR